MYRFFIPRNVSSSFGGIRCLSTRYHVICAGGGIMGCTSAYFLAQSIPPHQICIIERDPTYSQASTSLSLGSIRQQFSRTPNIRLSMNSVKFLKDDLKNHLSVNEEDLPDIQFVEGGYLFLASENGEKVLLENHNTQKKTGASVVLLSPSELKTRFPWINTAGVKLASLGTKNEGWFDPWLLLNAFKKKLLALGVQFIHGELVGFNINHNRIKHVQVKTASGEELELECSYVINSSGPFAARTAKMAGIGSPANSNSLMRVPLPVEPRKRCMYTFHCPAGPKAHVLLVDTSGVAARQESQEGMYVACMSPAEDEEDLEAVDLELDYKRFDDKLWPLLAHRVPAFEALKLKGGWAGFYEYNVFDQNAIIGPHPVLNNFIFANGFSGHGIQQSPAVGLVVSEIITLGKSVSIDVSELSFQRIINKNKFLEKNII